MQVDFRIFENTIKKINWYSTVGNQSKQPKLKLLKEARSKIQGFRCVI